MILSMRAEPADAQRLPSRTYTTADGLASSVILNIVPDSRGFLWFATRNGLSRFDGSQFRTYTTDDGLPHPVVNSFLETRAGEYWVATNGGGVCQFNNEGRPRFTCHDVGDNFLSNRVNALLEDRRRRIWMATDHGLFRMDQVGGGRQAIPIVVEGLTASASAALYEDSEGRLWVGQTHGVVRLDPDGRAAWYAVQGQRVHSVRQIIEHEGALWVGLNFGLLAFRPDRQPAPATPLQRTELRAVGPCFRTDGPGMSVPAHAGEACLSNERAGLPGDFVGALTRAPNGRLWIATNNGLAYVEGNRLARLAVTGHLPAGIVSELALDRQGHLWIATYAGAVRLTPDGPVNYGLEDGLGHLRIRSLFAQGDQVFAVSGEWVVNRFDGVRFEAMQPRVPEDAVYGYYSQGAFLDRTGRWWLLTDRGLYRLKPAATLEDAARRPPDAVYNARNGLPGDSVDRLFEDSRGDIWIGSRSREAVNLSRWDRASGSVRVFREGFAQEHRFPVAFAEDRSGAVWIGFEAGGLARYVDHRFTVFGTTHGVPTGLTALHVDATGRLWLASAGAGLSMLGDTDAAALRFDRFTTAEGLSSNNIQCIAEDGWGRIYLGTGRGVDRLDPATLRVKHFSTSDGLAADYVTAALRDHSGALWFGTNDGISRIVPSLDAPAPAPPVWIGEVRVGGMLLPVAELGASALADLTLGPDQNHVQIAFFGSGIGTGGPLRFRYRLDGAETEWTGPTDRRVVHYASLAPGRYRFIVEAVNGDGVVSDRPATVSFSVLPPLWRRWWVMTLGALLLLGAAYALHRFRVARLVEVERVRARIAADLHDDIGGNLSRIAIQSEVARREVAALMAASSSERRLLDIGETARTVVESLGDVVWSVDPGHDDLASVERRVQEHAADVLGARGVRWTFHGTATPAGRVVLDPESRHDLLLLFKEGITNIARHADASIASLHLRLAGDELQAELRDDGRGFDPTGRDRAPAEAGHGLANMQLRARRLGGHLEIQSAPGAGTRVRLSAPLRPRRRMNMRLRTRRPVKQHDPRGRTFP